MAEKLRMYTIKKKGNSHTATIPAEIKDAYNVEVSDPLLVIYVPRKSKLYIEFMDKRFSKARNLQVFEAKYIGDLSVKVFNQTAQPLGSKNPKTQKHTKVGVTIPWLAVQLHGLKPGDMLKIEHDIDHKCMVIDFEEVLRHGKKNSDNQSESPTT